jgi:hypothetical protein
MFDYLRCNMPLPGPRPPEGTLFQTKDTDEQYMETYTITEDGRLIHSARDYKWEPNPELAHLDGLLALRGALKTHNHREVEIPYHGDIEFHHYDAKQGWWSYIARFTEGRCVRITLCEHADLTHSGTPPRVSDEHPSGRRPKGAECEACQRGGEAETPKPLSPTPKGNGEQG